MRSCLASLGGVSMRKVSILMFTTIDGVAEFPEYAPDPEIPGTEEQSMWSPRMDSIDTLFLGRKSYEAWADFWPKQKDNPDSSSFSKQFSRFADKAEKIVVSRTLKEAKWPNSRIVSGDLAQEVNRLKALPGKNMAVGGGPRLAQSFLERDLADELILEMFPSLVGGGKPMFHISGDPNSPRDVVPLGTAGRHDFKLVEARPTPDGTVLLHFARAGRPTPR
jgi:dihydrofolate reductase